jgi:MFS family permease
LVAKFGWNDDETKLYNSLLTNISLIGIMVGAIAGGPIITYGRRRGVFLISALMLIGVVLTLILTLPTMIIGRFITGFAGGVYQICGIKAVQETVPGNLIGIYGTSSQILLSLGCFTVTTLGWLSLPELQENYSQDEWWRLSYGFPLVLVTIQVAFLLISWRQEPIDVLIKYERDEEALNFLPLIYKPKDMAPDG